MFGTRRLIGLASLAMFALWAGSLTLARLFASASSGRGAVIMGLTLIVVACAALTVAAAVLMVRVFRAEVARREADYQRYRDGDAPPWAQQ